MLTTAERGKDGGVRKKRREGNIGRRGGEEKKALGPQSASLSGCLNDPRSKKEEAGDVQGGLLPEEPLRPSTLLTFPRLTVPSPFLLLPPAETR